VVEDCEAEPVDTGETGTPGDCEPARMVLGVTRPLEEGESITIAARPSGCLPQDSEVRWEVEAGDLALCEIDGWSLECGLLDDGVLQVRASLYGTRGLFVDDEVLELSIANLAPQVQGNAYLYWDLSEGEALDVQLVAEDVPADTVSWELTSDAPPGLEVSASGAVTWESAQAGYWWLAFTVTDEDGGSNWVEAEMYVWEDGDSGPRDGLWRIVGTCLAIFGAAVAMVLLVLLGRPMGGLA
jgi:hypothetical protein